MKSRIVLVDDQVLLVKSLFEILQSKAPDLEVVARGRTGGGRGRAEVVQLPLCCASVLCLCSVYKNCDTKQMLWGRSGGRRCGSPGAAECGSCDPDIVGGDGGAGLPERLYQQAETIGLAAGYGLQGDTGLGQEFVEQVEVFPLERALLGLLKLFDLSLCPASGELA